MTIYTHDQQFDPSLPRAVALTGNITVASQHNGVMFYNATGTGYTITVPSGMPQGFAVAGAQQSTGTVTIAGPGVTLIPSSLATSAAGGMVFATGTAADTYLVKAS